MKDCELLDTCNSALSELSPLRVVVVGEVDDGKSTLIGRLLYETDSLPEGKVEELERISTSRGMPLEWSFILDAFQAERNQAVTIDITQTILNLPSRQIVLVDAPGHIEFLKNMVSGAADADAGLLVVDASKGIREQTRRHAFLLNLLAVQQVAVVINKMDLVNFSKDCYLNLVKDLKLCLEEAGISAVGYIPIAARHGDNLSKLSKNMPWYTGESILGIMSGFNYFGKTSGLLRIPVQDIYKFDERRIIVGRVESGKIKVGDKLLFSPSRQTAYVRSIEVWRGPTKQEASMGECIGITLDRPLFVERGNVISHVVDAPFLNNAFFAELFWFGEEPLCTGRGYKMKLGSFEASVEIKEVINKLDVETFTKHKTKLIMKNECGKVKFHSLSLIALDEYVTLPRTGRFVLIENDNIVAGGFISLMDLVDLRVPNPLSTKNIYQVPHYILANERAYRNGHKGGVLWLTGLSGAGKSTLAMQVEQHLFHQGYQIYVLDGDNVRSSLNSNLGFSPAERAENIRRIGEVATLFADAGLICVTAFISPYQSDREKVRQRFPKGAFHEIYVKADVSTCESRDPKGLYKKAIAGEIQQFTGVSAPYEIPENPELVVDTEKNDIVTCVEMIINYVRDNFITQALEKNENEKFYQTTDDNVLS